MKKLILLLIGAGFLGLLGVRLQQEFSRQEEASPPAGRAGPGRPSLLVATGLVEPHRFETTLEVLGELQPQAEVEVMSQISGRLQQVLGERGEAVRKGSLLAVVDDVDLRQQMRRAEAAIAVAAAGVNRESVSHRNLIAQVERYRDLYTDSLISAQELEDLESRVGVAAAQLELARAQVEQAEASLRELKILQEKTRIHAPLDGFIGSRHLEPGAVVSPSVPILSLLRLDRVKTVVPVSESVLRRIRPGLQAEIRVDAYPDQIHRGAVTRISPFLDPATRTADVEIEVDNPGYNLKPGMFARVRIDVRIASTALSVPRAALLTRGEREGVFLLNEDMSAVFQPILSGRITGEVVEILSGLEEGVEVVTLGSQNLNDGDRVRVQ